jgi:hypothetical protein
MIFMNCFSRSSRATGPKMRVPRGSFSLLMRTTAFLVEADVGAVLAAVLLHRAHDDRLRDLALLDRGARDRVLHRHDHDVAEASVPPMVAAEHLDALGALRARVVRHGHHRSKLDHG